MFEALSSQPPDAIMALMDMCKADSNPMKMDLGVGVYKNDAGQTVILESVKTAEALWWKEEETKTYVSTTGNTKFCRLMLEMMLGVDNPVFAKGLIASAQTAGGSGALRLGAEIIAAATPAATVWGSRPTWANHIPLISSAGLEMDSYPYYNRETLGVDFDEMLTHLQENAQAGDVVLLHGCCHNPTGADLSKGQWDRLADFLLEQDLMPFIDLAYLGLGQGLVEDSYGLRKIVSVCPEMIVAASCSKNFALYRERTGLVAMVTKTPEITQIVQGQLGSIQRKIISMPPDHGAALVVRILEDGALRALWLSELDGMRERIHSLRQQLSEALSIQGGEAMSRALRDQKGMFSTLPISQAQAERLRAEHSIYLTNSGRINIAGAHSENIPRFVEALLAVI